MNVAVIGKQSIKWYEKNQKNPVILSSIGFSRVTNKGVEGRLRLMSDIRE